VHRPKANATATQALLQLESESPGRDRGARDVLVALLDQPIRAIAIRSGTPRSSSTVAAGVPGVVESDVAHVGGVQQVLPVLGVGAMVDRGAAGGAKTQPAFLPELSPPFRALPLVSPGGCAAARRAEREGR
jgi:hypothetical protein